MCTNNDFIYIYNLPHTERKELCHILDQNDKWEELAGAHMKYDITTIQSLKREFFRGNSPSEELIELWSVNNHTILELFMLLNKMRHYRAMTIIKEFVDPQYHCLIQDGEHNQNRLMVKLGFPKPINRNTDIPRGNFNDDDSEKIVNIDRKLNSLMLSKSEAVVSNENNESRDLKNNQALPAKLPSPLGRSNALTVSSISSCESSITIPQITYEELTKSTNNWDVSTILGRGGFGTVFKGVWKCTQVAIKRIEDRGGNNPEVQSEQIKQSFTELHCLNAYRHDNILPVYGYSLGGPQPCLVYQYMSGGSLEYRLRTRDVTKLLSWSKRLNIAIGIARGLQFLHTIGDKPLIHGDIKPANILLDPNDNAKIGDFGLAQEGPQSHYTHKKVSTIHGTRPYLPNEFLREKKVSTKVDTYSFGVVLFEITTALSAYSEKREKDCQYLKDYIMLYKGNVSDLKDERVENGDSCFKGLIDIGKLCVSKNRKDRPEMVTVLILLEGVRLE